MLAGLAQLVRQKWIATNVTQDGLYAAPSTLIWSYLVSGGYGSCNYTVAACPRILTVMAARVEGSQHCNSETGSIDTSTAIIDTVFGKANTHTLNLESQSVSLMICQLHLFDKPAVSPFPRAATDKMKFLCLHGAYGNIAAFRVQLKPMMDLLEADGSASFEFIQGRVSVAPPPGFESYFGPKPHFRFLKDRGEAEASAVEGIRVFPEAETPEDALRALMPKDDVQVGFADARGLALDQLYEALDADPEIAGIIGYSEGASAAATLVYDEQERMRSEGYVPRIKAAIFFMGWPALTAENVPALSDEVENLLEVPSLHITHTKTVRLHCTISSMTTWLCFSTVRVVTLSLDTAKDNSVEFVAPAVAAKRLDSAVDIPYLRNKQSCAFLQSTFWHKLESEASGSHRLYTCKGRNHVRFKQSFELLTKHKLRCVLLTCDAGQNFWQFKHTRRLKLIIPDSAIFKSGLSSFRHAIDYGQDH
ncbi:putative DUF341 family oxidoreductase, partial [Aureobasidium melanogenum]